MMRCRFRHNSVTGILLSALVLMSCGAERNLKRAEKHLALGEYYDAASEYKQAYRKTEPKRRDRRGVIAKKMAFCYAKSLQTAKGIAAFRNTIRYQQDDAADRLLLGQLLLKNGSYKEAEAEFLAVLDSLPDSKPAQVGLQTARSAPGIKELCAVHSEYYSTSIRARPKQTTQRQSFAVSP